MIVSTRVVNAVLLGAGALLLSHFVQSVCQHSNKRINKKLAKQAVHQWEGEGGNIIDPVPGPAKT